MKKSQAESKQGNQNKVMRHLNFFSYFETRVIRSYLAVSSGSISGLVKSQSGLPDGLVSNQKAKIWVNFGGPFNGNCWYILWPFGIFYGHLVKFMAVWYGLWSFVIFFPIWNVGTKKNLATLVPICPSYRTRKHNCEKSSSFSRHMYYFCTWHCYHLG
jgi:hypothetical protein